MDENVWLISAVVVFGFALGFNLALKDDIKDAEVAPKDEEAVGYPYWEVD